MLAIIGNFDFKVDDTSFDEFESRVSFGWATFENLGGFNTYQSVGKYEEQLLLKGVLICKSQNQLTEFENMAKQKKQQTLAFSNGKAYQILIFGINKTKKNFLRTGEFLEQSYQIDLQVVGGKR